MKHQNKKSSWLVNILLILPVILLLAIWLAVKIYFYLLPPPLWVLSASAAISGDSLKGAELPTSGQPQAAPLTGETIPSWRAALASWKMLNDQTNKDVVINNGPSLVIASYPNGLTRLAWRSISLVSSSEDGATGIAVAAFVDADTGQPMAVIHDIPVYNPHQSALSGISFVSRNVLLLRNGPLILMGFYLIFMAIILMALSLFHRQAQG